MSVRAREGSREKLRRRLRGDLDNIVLKALRKEPERRYTSVDQFSEDIRRHLEGLPVIARPDTFWYRGGKFVRRHKAGVIAAICSGGAGGWPRDRAAPDLRGSHRTGPRRSSASTTFARWRIRCCLKCTMRSRIFPGPPPHASSSWIAALRYLDAIAKEAKGNLSLQRELAAAYQKVGDVQGGFRAANLGDTAGALASYKKSLAILEAVSRPIRETSRRGVN